MEEYEDEEKAGEEVDDEDDWCIMCVQQAEQEIIWVLQSMHLYQMAEENYCMQPG